MDYGTAKNLAQRWVKSILQVTIKSVVLLRLEWKPE